MFFKTSFKKTLILVLGSLLIPFFICAQESEYSYEDYLREYGDFFNQTDFYNDEAEEDLVIEAIKAEEVEEEVAAEDAVEQVEPEPVEEVKAQEPVLPEETPMPGESAEDEDEVQVETATESPAPTENPAPESESEEEEKNEYQALALIRYKNTDTISFKFKVSYIPKPYILGLSLAAGFTEYKLIQPFYFGGYLEPHVGIPQKKFPYQYSLNGKSIKGPLIIGGKLYTPFGICVFPFQENIEFFVEFAPGLSLNMMWDAKFGKDSITSKLYPAFYGMLRTGATYKGFTFFIEGNYDAILGFGVSAGIGYSLNFDLSPTVDHAPSLK